MDCTRIQATDYRSSKQQLLWLSGRIQDKITHGHTKSSPALLGAALLQGVQPRRVLARWFIWLLATEERFSPEGARVALLWKSVLAGTEPEEREWWVLYNSVQSILCKYVAASGDASGGCAVSKYAAASRHAVECSAWDDTEAQEAYELQAEALITACAAEAELIKTEVPDWTTEK